MFLCVDNDDFGAIFVPGKCLFDILITGDRETVSRLIDELAGSLETGAGDT